ncbi:MAG: sulfite exporter TauE/SafE family protein, partial [bacterium]
MDYSLLTIFSFFIGIVVGLTGIGGSSLITPL